MIQCTISFLLLHINNLLIHTHGFFSVASSLLNDAQTRQIGIWLQEINKIGAYKKCYGLMEPSKDFYWACNKRDTITIFKSKGGEGYHDKNWNWKHKWTNKYVGGFTEIPWREGQSTRLYCDFHEVDSKLTSLRGQKSDLFIHDDKMELFLLRIK